MPVVGEWAWQDWANSVDNGDYWASWDIDFPPQSAFVKVVQGGYSNWNDVSSANIYLRNLRRRLPNGQDETIKFGGTDDTLVAFDPAMTHVSYGIHVYEAYAHLVWTIEFWE